MGTYVGANKSIILYYVRLDLIYDNAEKNRHQVKLYSYIDLK